MTSRRGEWGWQGLCRTIVNHKGLLLPSDNRTEGGGGWWMVGGRKAISKSVNRKEPRNADDPGGL